MNLNKRTHAKKGIGKVAFKVARSHEDFTLPFVPSPQREGNLISPSSLGGEPACRSGRGEGEGYFNDGIRRSTNGRMQRGIALLLVLWVLTILMVMVFSFSALSRTETTSALGFREMLEKKNLAEAGVERGIFEIIFRKQKARDIIEEAWMADGTPYAMDLGEGHSSVRIIEESGKIDLNMLTDANGIILKNLLVLRGVAGEEADTIVDSLLDWKDGGDSDAHRLHGAETDYYQSLPVPYSAKNADFDTVEELLLVKGMTAGILFGSRETKGIDSLLTVHSKSSKININAAPRDVLAAVPGIGPEFAETVVSERQTRKALTLADVQAVLGQNYASAAPFISVAESMTFTIESSGYKEKEQSGYGIRATVTFADMNRYRYVSYKAPVRTMQ